MQSIKSKPPRLLLPKDLLFAYLSKNAAISSKFVVDKINLDASLGGVATDPDSKTATVAINTDDEAWSVSNEQSWTTFQSCIKSQKMQNFQLKCMEYFWFPLYGILEKAVQTEISIPLSKGAGLLISGRVERKLIKKRRKPEGRVQMKAVEKTTRLKKLLEEDMQIHNTRRLVINKILEEDLNGT